MLELAAFTYYFRIWNQYLDGNISWSKFYLKNICTAIFCFFLSPPVSLSFNLWERVFIFARRVIPKYVPLFIHSIIFSELLPTLVGGGSGVFKRALLLPCFLLKCGDSYKYRTQQTSLGRLEAAWGRSTAAAPTAPPGQDRKRRRGGRRRRDRRRDMNPDRWAAWGLPLGYWGNQIQR